MEDETFEDVPPVIPDDEEPSRYIGRVYHLDANRINAKQKDQHVNEIEKWAKNGIIGLDMSEPAYSEGEKGSKQREKKASEYIFVEAVDCLGGENECRKTIEDILFHSGAKDSNQTNDIRILFTAKRAGATLITNDLKHMLRNKGKLKHIGISVKTAEEAINEIKALIKIRDKKAVEYAKKKDKPLPTWVGRD